MINEVIQSDYKTLLPLIENETIAAVITDPPFGIDYQNNYTHQQHNKIEGDSTLFDYTEFGQHAFRVLKPNCPLFCFTGWSEYPHHFQELANCGFSMKEPIICQKRPSGKTDLFGAFQSNADWCIFAHKGRFKFKKTCLLKNKRAGTIPNKGRKPVPEFKTRFPACWFGPEYPWSTENPVFQKQFPHPTIKSQKFIEWLILLSTNEGDVILDPFLGSGTVAAAALSLNRKFVGCEISEAYCKMAKLRINKICCMF